MSGDNLQEKSFYDSTKNPDTLSSVHQQDNERKCARTRHASSQPNDVIELSSGSEGEDDCIMSNSTSFVSGSAAAAASTSLDSTQDHHHDFAGDIRPRDFGGTSQSGGMTSGRSGHTRTSSMSGVASATATSSSVTSSSVLHGSVEDHEHEILSAGGMCSRMSTSHTTSPSSPSTALAMKLAHGHSQQYVSKVDTSKDLEIATGMAKNDQHDILAKLSSVKSKRSLSLFSAPSSSRAKKSKVKIKSSSHRGSGTSPEVWDQAARNFLSASSKSFAERSSYYDGNNVGSHHAGEYL